MNIKNIIFLVLIILLGSLQHLTAQIEQPKRLEFKIGEGEEFYMVVSLEENGLMLFREPERKNEKGFTTWEFVAVDTALSKKWTKNYQIDYDYVLNGYAVNGEFLYVLYRMGSNLRDNFNIIKMNIHSGDTTHHIVKKIIPVQLTEFEVVGNSAILGGHVNFRPAVLHFDFESTKAKVLPGIYRTDSDLIEVKIDESLKTFNVLITERTLDKLFTVTMLTFNEQGELLQNVKLDPKEDISLIFGRSTEFKGRDRYIAGTYAFKKSNYSRGIYIAHINPRGEEEIKYYSYADLENFFDYMKAGRQARVKKRIERKRVKGKKAKFTYRLQVHDIIEQDDQFILIGEAFYPRYSSSLFYGGFDDIFIDSRGNYNRLNFIGYKYTHAVVIGFDKDGKLLWDNSFEINDVLSYDLKKFVNVSVDDQNDKIVLLYIYENVIRSKLIQGDEVIEGKSFDDIKLKFEDDVVKNNDTEVGGLEKWYNDYFFAYGVQRIRNMKDKGVSINREVFFINKVIYK